MSFKAENYFELFVKEVKEMIDSPVQNRIKFAMITRLSYNVLDLYQIVGVDNINFKDLDLTKFEREQIKNRVHALSHIT